MLSDDELATVSSKTEREDSEVTQERREGGSESWTTAEEPCA